MAPDPAAPALIEHRLTAGRRTGKELARRWYRGTVRRPIHWIVVVLLVGLSVVVLLALDVFWMIPVVTPVLIGVFVVVTYRGGRRVFEQTFLPGSEHTAAFGPDTMTMSGPVGSSLIRYDAIREVRVLRGPVAVSLASGRPTLMVPAELFPPEAVELVRSRLAPSTC